VTNKPPSFKDLVPGVVPFERPQPKRDAAAAIPSSAANPVVVKRRPEPRFRVETQGELVFGYADGASFRSASELGMLGPDLPCQRVDLHRMPRSRALATLASAVAAAIAAGERYLLVICGRGTHSGTGGAVLPEAVVEELSGSLARYVVAFRTAPPGLGGSGAFMVRLARAHR
jgi:DNA-nicking Smr family endonuclease